MTLLAKPKILTIVGPTASGKSDLAVRIAEWIASEKIGPYTGAEIISADSRQVYIGLDIGTGKITPTEMRGIPHHLLDVADPQTRFTTMDWKNLTEQAVKEIQSRGKLPIICGGTGFYISTFIDDLGFPDVEADTDEQKKLEEKSVDELFLELKKVDPSRSSTIDPKNKRRLARAIIIARALGSVPPIQRPVESKYDTQIIGISIADDKLKQRIHARLIQRLDNGMIEEAKKLHEPNTSADGLGLSYERMDELGLEYRYLGYLLKNELTKEELIERLSSKIWQYAKRQMTWFKRDKRIQWYTLEQYDSIQESIKSFLVGK